MTQQPQRITSRVQNEVLIISSAIISMISFAIGHSIFVYDSYPFAKTTSDVNIIALHFIGFNVLGIFGAFMLFSTFMELPQSISKKCVWYTIFITILATFILFNPFASIHLGSKKSALNLYKNSQNFLQISIPIFYLNSAFSTWFLWEMSQIERVSALAESMNEWKRIQMLQMIDCS